MDHGNETTGSIASVGHTHTADTIGNTTYVWRHTSQGLTVETYLLSVETASASNESTVCLSHNGTTTCRALGNETTVSFEISRNATERSTGVDISLWDGSPGEVIDNESYTLQPLSRLDDADRDGLNNAAEVRLGADLTANDTDGDGITDGVEATAYNTSIVAADTDGDGLSDARELFEYETSPTAADTDGDGITDDVEVAAGYNATAPDTDGDGVLDGAELAAGTDPTLADTDGDGVGDGTERDLGSDPLATDTDSDGLADGREQQLGTDPTKSDTDDDGLSDSRETAIGSDPLSGDTDGDGLSDGSELERSSDPLAADTDGDGLADGREVAVGTALLNPDSDGDGLTDGREQRLGTDPTTVDSDGDYLSDGVESTLGTDPTSRLTLVWLSALGGTLVCTGLLVPSIRRGYISNAVDRVRGVEDAVVGRQATTESEVVTDTADAGPGDEDTGGDASPTSAAAVVEARSDDGLVTDSELVGEMLRAEDGRMKQSHIVETTDWSKSKVSRVLSKKADDGEITKLRLGRENLVCLEHAQPAVVTSDPRTDTGLSPPNGAVSGGI
ncbi:DUF7343 domain-containing protein [Haloarcula onubensis]|uniref:DUF7343 domain-containing protein n=1 Tax=Haloarcula onubensis TaxID=2950539 RepID=A0ABU2FQV8_9EURY|nr:hypothetical protein [Halomicroarcula sp. S3CR25-11]MDS0282637.1 hypothetical protein [Halomicroarcula sp. S3CR25-11]